MAARSRYNKRNRRRGKRPWAVVLGSGVIVLAIVGLICLIVLAVQGIGGLLNNDEEKAAVEDFISPVVMMDPPAFESVSELDTAVVCEIALRAVLIENSDSSAFLTDDLGRMIVPLSEVEKKCAALFGEGISFTPSTIGDGESAFEYVEVESAFHIPALAQTGYYLPKVLELHGAGGNRLTAKVGYIPADESSWGRNEKGEAVMPDPVKYMTYTLEKREDTFILLGIEAEGGATPVTASSSQLESSAVDSSSQAESSSSEEAPASSESVSEPPASSEASVAA